MLQFLGRGAAFADEHNSAFFIHDSELILLDCPVTAFQKIKRMFMKEKLEAIKHIYILLTHTHGDHAGGTGMMIQYAWFGRNHLPVTVIAPSEEVREDLYLLLMRIEGCDKSWFSLTTSDSIHKSWLKESILTTHVESLKGKCFGWCLHIDGQQVIYTGDTAALEPYQDYLEKGSILYAEASAFDTHVHLYIDAFLPVFVNLTQKGITVYLMHMDDEAYIRQRIQGTEIQIAPVIEEET